MAQPDPLPSIPHDERIELEVPGTETFLEVLRGVVGRIARMSGFSYDGIEDFCLAVDEAAALVLESRPSTLHLTIRREDHRLGVVVVGRGQTAPWPPPGLEDDMRWQVIRVLVEDHRLGEGASITLSQTVR